MLSDDARFEKVVGSVKERPVQKEGVKGKYHASRLPYSLGNTLSRYSARRMYKTVSIVSIAIEVPTV